MKLRLRENSIRLRLLQNEIKQLEKHGFVTESIYFRESQTLTYRLKMSEGVDKISAHFQIDEITIEIPRSLAETWIKTDQIGLQTEQKVDAEKALFILIEKDFVCVDRPMDADNLDAFPHPKMKC